MLYYINVRIKCRWKCKYLYNNTYDFRKLWLDNDAMHVHSRDKIRVSKYYSWTDLSPVHFRLDSKIIRCYVLFERVFSLTEGKMYKFSEHNISLQISTNSKKIIFKLFKLLALSVALTRTDISLFVVRVITAIKN
jgi:hypothetical protein